MQTIEPALAMLVVFSAGPAGHSGGRAPPTGEDAMADIEIKPITWRTCAEDGCIGACLPNGDTCWAHAIDADVDQALKRLGIDGRLDARGVPITPELLERMLAAAPTTATAARG
jgi:hypothetical protein